MTLYKKRRSLVKKMLKKIKKCDNKKFKRKPGIINCRALSKFISELPPGLKEPIDKTLCQMLDSSKYIDDSTLIYDEDNEYGYDKEHYHNWDCEPQIIESVKAYSRYKKDYDENNDTELTKLLNEGQQNIELVKGDVQLGKRVHSCILMWISIHIYKRPVVYLFRPLEVDKTQFLDDIEGGEDWNFNIEYIKNNFNDKFNDKIKNNMKKKKKDYDDKAYHDYKLPSFTDIKDKNVANKLDNHEYLSKPKMIYIAFMNPSDLEKLNRQFYNYICTNHKKVNITLIVDESDLLSPTAENSNNISKKDTINTKSERLISKLVCKVAHTIHITGTAHAFFWNYTTALNENTKTVIPVVKAFVMKRRDDYYGVMKKNINFSSDDENLPIITEWWSKEDKYNIDYDYNINMKPLISSIVKRKNPYSSLLISEEKLKDNQINLAEKIIKDFKSLFCVVFHGKQGKYGLPTGLRLYFPKKIDNLVIQDELYQVVSKDSADSKRTRLDAYGGIKGYATSDDDTQYRIEGYKYYDICMKSKRFNIKMIYRVMAMLFKKIKSNKTIITITGKYGDRGYSFTSDYYGEDDSKVLHLTDQYFVSHTNYVMADILQRLRIQGRYKDKPYLIFWSTKNLIKMLNLYVDYSGKIDNKIMSLSRGHEHIRILCQSYLYDKEFVIALGGGSRKGKNLQVTPVKYDRKNIALILSLPPYLKPEKFEEHFADVYEEKFNGFINRIKESELSDYLNENGVWEHEVPIRIEKSSIVDIEEMENSRKKLTNELKEIKDDDNKKKEISDKIKDMNNKLRSAWEKFTKEKYPKFKDYKFGRILRIDTGDINDRYKGIETYIDINMKYNCKMSKYEKKTYNVRYYTDKKRSFIHITSVSDNSVLPKSYLDIINKQNYKKINDNKILHSTLKYEFIKDELAIDSKNINEIELYPYFFLTADGYVYHHDPEKSIKRVTIKIKSEIEESRNNNLINPILTFKEQCIKENEGCERVGVKKVMQAYNSWCEKNGFKKYEKMKNFREDFEEITNLKRSKTNKLGYKIELKI